MLTVIYSDHLLFSQHYPMFSGRYSALAMSDFALLCFTPKSVMQINMNKIIKELLKRKQILIK